MLIESAVYGLKQGWLTDVATPIEGEVAEQQAIEA